MSNDLEKTVSELELELGELTLARKRATTEMIGIQQQITDVNLNMVQTLPLPRYQCLVAQRFKLVQQMMEKQKEIGVLKQRIIELTTVSEVRKQHGFGTDTVRQLVEIRDRWHGFSMDKSNSQKAREVAWKVSQELRTVLQPIFKPLAESHKI